MSSRIYRAWCPELGQEPGEGIVAIAADPARAAETWAAWADAYLDAGVSAGSTRRVLVAEGAGEPVELVVSGYLAAVYGALPPEQHDRAVTERPPLRRGEIHQRPRGTVPPLPRPRRLRGTAYTAEGEAAIYTDHDMRIMRSAVYAAGREDAASPLDPAVAVANGAAREAAAYERRTGRKARD